MSQPMTAAEYRRNAEAKRAQQATEIVTLKSGSVFELRRPDLQVWVMTGRVPQSLLEAGMNAWKQQGKLEGHQETQAKVVTDSAIFFTMLVQSCTVNPRLVEFPDPGKNEIGPETMLDEDFFEIVNWAMSHEGVAGVDGLRSFRPRRKRRSAGARNDSAELQPETIGSSAN